MKNDLEQIIETKYGKIVFKFPVLRFSGSPYDCHGFVVEDLSQQRLLILTKDNVPFISTIEQLQSKLAEYTKVNFDTKKALTLLTNYKI